jgi:predicted HTH domain antitoxin
MEDMIATCALTLELPEELVALLGSLETAAAKAREALVLTLLREGQISQGKVARLLGLTRWDILDLMVQHQIPSGPATPEELRQEVEDLHRFVQSKNQRACHQQQ